MRLASDTLLAQIAKHVEAYSTIVWYDPNQDYADFAHSLVAERVAGALMRRHDQVRGLVWLRRELEPFWAEREDPPRLILYVPMSQTKAQNALIEFEVAGAVMQPAQHSLEQNTALEAVARRALAAVLPEAQLEKIVSQVESGHLSLSELDNLAERGIDALTDVIVTIFGTGSASEVAVRFLSDPLVDTEIESRQSVGSLAGLLSEALGVSLQALPRRLASNIGNLRTQAPQASPFGQRGIVGT